MNRSRNELHKDNIKAAIVRLETVRNNIIVKMSKGTIQAQSYLGLVSTADKDIEYLKSLLYCDIEDESKDSNVDEVIKDTKTDDVEVITNKVEVIKPAKNKGRPKGSTNK